MSYFDHKRQYLVAWASVASAPTNQTVLARSEADEIIIADNLGEEWMNLSNADVEMGEPVAWAPAPYIPEQVSIKEVLSYLSEEDRDMIVACLEGDAAPDHIDREFIEWGIFVPALQGMYMLGGSKHSPCGFGLCWKLTEFGTAVAEHIAEADSVG